MPIFRKKPVVIEAFQVPAIGEDPSDEMVEFLNQEGVYEQWENGNDGEILIHTLEGDMVGTYGDWIIKGVAGEIYPCKPDIFNETYNPELTEEEKKNMYECCQ
jgi:hypothetical protein